MRWAHPIVSLCLCIGVAASCDKDESTESESDETESGETESGETEERRRKRKRRKAKAPASATSAQVSWSGAPVGFPFPHPPKPVGKAVYERKRGRHYVEITSDASVVELVAFYRPVFAKLRLVIEVINLVEGGKSYNDRDGAIMRTTRQRLGRVFATFAPNDHGTVVVRLSAEDRFLRVRNAQAQGSKPNPACVALCKKEQSCGTLDAPRHCDLMCLYGVAHTWEKKMYPCAKVSCAELTACMTEARNRLD